MNSAGIRVLFDAGVAVVAPPGSIRRLLDFVDLSVKASIFDDVAEATERPASSTG